MKKSSIFECVRLSSISSPQLDRWLAGGWFRNGQQLFRTQLLMMDGKLYTTINIRLPLKNHQFPKRIAKIYRRNTTLFRSEVRPANFYSEDKQRLFDQHRSRFKGTSVRELWRHFSNDGYNMYDTFELCVYDGDQLVAMSFFDIGEKGLASILGVFDQRYSKHSLGLYTMMQEVELAKALNCHFYYPGYVLDRPSSFDYKLRLGKYHRYDWHTKRWNLFEKPWPITLATQVEQSLAELKQALDDFQLGYAQKWYQYYLWQYYPDYVGMPTLINSPLVYMCGYSNGFLVAGYDADAKQFFLARTGQYVDYHTMAQNIDFSPESSNRLTHQLDVFYVNEWLALSQNPNDVARSLYILFRVEPHATALIFERNGWFQTDKVEVED
ncbi:MAG: hypothetical protein U0Y10_21395 [Spirosomataceae bacterium]